MGWRPSGGNDQPTLHKGRASSYPKLCHFYVALWPSFSWFFFGYVPGFTEKNFALVGERYQEIAMLAIIGAAFTPIPFKIFTIAAILLFALLIGGFVVVKYLLH